jgi:hypothetical protein
MARSLEHFPEKWTPVFRRKCDHFLKSRALSDLTKAESALAGVIGAAILVAVAGAALGASTSSPGTSPDWKGEWVRLGAGSFDPDKPAGLGQKAPLTPEYQAVLERSLADQAAGGQGNNTMGECIPPGMPRTMINYEGMEIIVTPETTYIYLNEPGNQLRRIYTDARPWPDHITPTYLGYSIGEWVDRDAAGRYHALAVETRAIRGPHSYDSSGMPFHQDGQAVIKERFAADPAKPDLIRDEITIMDHALTRPWTVTRSYRHVAPATWFEVICAEDNHQVRIGRERYYVGGDGYLMPTRPGQSGPDLRNFDRPGK